MITKATFKSPPFVKALSLLAFGILVSIAGVSVPALEVGGDFYDYLGWDGNDVMVVVGDVSGKGTSAALYMSKVQGILRSLYGFDLQPREGFIRANRLLCNDLEKTSFVTALGARYVAGERRLTPVRAGHLPLYHYHASDGNGGARPDPRARTRTQ